MDEAQTDQTRQGETSSRIAVLEYLNNSALWCTFINLASLQARYVLGIQCYTTGPRPGSFQLSMTLPGSARLGPVRLKRYFAGILSASVS